MKKTGFPQNQKNLLNVQRYCSISYLSMIYLVYYLSNLQE